MATKARTTTAKNTPMSLHMAYRRVLGRIYVWGPEATARASVQIPAPYRFILPLSVYLKGPSKRKLCVCGGGGSDVALVRLHHDEAQDHHVPTYCLP